ncbi:hypothetical protein PRIC2_005915 [Phytophthora ramorum]
MFLPTAEAAPADMMMLAEEEQEEKQEEEEEAVNEEGTANKEEDDDDVDQEVVDVDREEEEEVQFVGSVEGPHGRDEDEKRQEEEDDDVVVVESGEDQRSRANSNALMAANGFVTAATLEAELQCIICQYTMFKPVSVICGHSFCRVCLMDSFLTRSIEEAQCPICRVEILQPFSAKSSLSSIFSINVTLWNLVQLLIPPISERVAAHQQEEEEEFTHKLDQLDAKWKMFTLSERAARYHGDDDDEDARSSDRTRSPRWEENHEGHEEYPVVKVEDTEEGNLHVSRNVVLDTNDENEDGYINMRVGLSIVEFPSIFELYNEHQECSVNIIKMEEDEEMADGMPFFMSEDGDDDGFVCSSYYNEISLRVCDEAGNCVMERTRGAQGGVVTFPGLRLDVPGGVYTFRFVDDLYGLKLSITTRLREPHELSDTPVADYVTLIHDEARDASRRGRGRHDSDDEVDNEVEGNESDDSFIVDDLNGEVHEEEPVGHFSDDEVHWEYHSDDEAADEDREQRRVRRRQRSGRRADRDVQLVDEQEEEELSGEEGEHESPSGPDDTDEHEEEEEVEVRSGRRNVRVVEEAATSSDEEAGEDVHESNGGEEGEEEEEEHHDAREVTQPRNANQIVDSEDEDGGAAAESDEEHKEDTVSDGAQSEQGTFEENLDAFRKGLVVAWREIRGEGDVCSNSDGAQSERAENSDRDEGVDVHDGANEDDEPTSRKVKRAQWFQEEESEEEDKPPEPDAAFSPDEEDERRPRKRARGRDRQVRVVDEGESDEEQELMERSIAVANSTSAPDSDEDADEDADSSSQFRRVHQLNDEEGDEDDASQDYPDEDEEEADDGEFSE